MEATGTFCRHPLYLAADKLKTAFHMLGFQLVDNAEGPEVEMADVTFATWEEPAQLFGWQSDPIYLGEGDVLLRPRLLPAKLGALAKNAPARILAFGRVYNKSDASIPMRSHMEGFVAEDALTFGHWLDVWNQYAVAMFGIGASATLEAAGESSYKIVINDQANETTYDLGYTGPASEQARKAAGIKDDARAAWVFVIDVDEFALAYFSLEDRAQFYQNDVAFLRAFKSDFAAGGYTAEYRAADALRRIGYLETCGATIYPDGIYVKMNMIQEAWDTNNQGYPLVEPLAGMTALRTVQTPALEEILAYNYALGNKEVKVFEVGHIYSPVLEQRLPKERFSISMGAYGPDVTLETFQKDVEAVLQALGITAYMFVPTDMAIAYKTDECLLVLDGNGTYLEGNFGRISEIAEANFGIGTPAYQAQLELPALVLAGQRQRGEILP